jgi:flavin-dependent dehydrogenase
MERWDALVVGAGPAGSLTAFHLARGGARVLLVDKARFPRDKPCGGGLTVRAQRQLPFSVDPVVEGEVDVFDFGFRYQARFVRRTREPLIRMTRRRRLDAFLVDQAREAGAEFREGWRPGGVEATVVIGADGANGTVGRELGLRDHLRTVALEGNVRVDPAPFARRAVIELGLMPGGYAWVFPKADHVNVGVGGGLDRGPQLRDELHRLCRQHGIPVEALEGVRGHHLPLRRPGATAARGRTALVGDAAGLVDPVSGDGIYEAALSARLAAANALDIVAGRVSDFGPYAGELRRRLAVQATASWRARAALEHFPRATYTLLRAPLAVRAIEALLRADAQAPREIGGAGGLALRAADWLGRLRPARV